jgi:hypothetical protein
LRQTSTVIFCAIDAFLPLRGKIQAGFDEFSVALDHAGVPAIWTTSRSRAQMDEPIRKLGHRHPFIAEDGSGVYLPEGYFHLRPEKTLRLGRFTCIPIAERQPAASEALESISEETGVPIVALRSLSPHELAQNLGLPVREAELARQRDFDELFFCPPPTGGSLVSFLGSQPQPVHSRALKTLRPRPSFSPHNTRPRNTGGIRRPPPSLRSWPAAHKAVHQGFRSFRPSSPRQDQATTLVRRCMEPRPGRHYLAILKQRKQSVYKSR